MSGSSTRLWNVQGQELTICNSSLSPFCRAEGLPHQILVLWVDGWLDRHQRYHLKCFTSFAHPKSTSSFKHLSKHNTGLFAFFFFPPNLKEMTLNVKNAHLCIARPRVVFIFFFTSFWIFQILSNKYIVLGFPGGAVVENLPANAGDTGSSPGLGRSHMPRSN